jgi:hypothetical protein
MKMNNPMRYVLACGLIAAAGCASSESQDKVVLRGAATPGLAYTQERTEKVGGWMTVKADGAEYRQPLVKDERRVFEDEVLEVDGGRVMKLRRKNVEWVLKRQAPGDTAMTAVPRTTVGKTIVLRRTDLGTVYEEADGLPEEELKANLLGALEVLVSPPAEAIAPGATWELDGENIVEMFGGEGGGRALKIRSASGTGRLDSIDANRIAHITVKLSAGGAFRALLDVEVTLEMTAHFRFDLASGRPVSLDAHADGKISGEVDRKGKPAVYSGEFTFDATASNRYR